VQNLYDKVKNQTRQQNKRYAKPSSKKKREIIFEEGDWVWLHLRKDRFPKHRK